jgi:hypothetical protein
MTTLTMRLVKGDFIVTGPDIARMKFKSRPEARLVPDPPPRLAHHRDRSGRQTRVQENGQATEPVNREGLPEITHQRAPLSHGGAF